MGKPAKSAVYQILVLPTVQTQTQTQTHRHRHTDTDTDTDTPSVFVRRIMQTNIVTGNSSGILPMEEDFLTVRVENVTPDRHVCVLLGPHDTVEISITQLLACQSIHTSQR